MPVPTSPAPLLRASDAEREAAVARLHHAFGEGRLDLAETEARVAAAYAATHGSDLVPLLADLPPELSGRSERERGLDVGRVVGAGSAAGVSADPPDRRQHRFATTITVIAVVWTLLCAFLGAALVAS